jgi:4-carboxymuconolactone decarboxylase
MSGSDRFERGAEVFEKVIGWRPPAEGPDWLKITVENLFGDVWGREGLSIRDRRLVTLTILLTMLKEDSLRPHLEQTLKNGELSRPELMELMIHVAHYAGWPVGQFGFDCLMKVLAERKAAAADQR